MTLSESIDLILTEGVSERGIVVEIRMGTFPARDRMAALNQALLSVRDGMKDKATIDRQLAHALFALGFHIQGDIDGKISRDFPIPEHFIEEGMVEMFMVITSIFDGAD